MSGDPTRSAITSATTAERGRSRRNREPRARAAVTATILTGLLLLTVGLARPAGADDTLTLTVTPATLTAAEFAEDGAVTIKLTCPSALGQVTVTVQRPDRPFPSNLLTNFGVSGTSMTFSTSMSPAPPGDYVFSASSTLCGSATPATITVTGETTERSVTASTTHPDVAEFATTGITFDGAGFTPGTTVTVSSLVPGSAPTTLTVEADGTFTHVQRGEIDTEPGWYETRFSSPTDGAVALTFLVGIPAANPPGGAAATLTPTSLRRIVYMTLGVHVELSGYSPSDLITIKDVGPTGAISVRAVGKPDADGTFTTSFDGTTVADADRVGVHTVVVSSPMTTERSLTYEVTADPPVVATADPDPVPAGESVTFRATSLVPGTNYVLLLDDSIGTTIVAPTDADGVFTWSGTIPEDYPQGDHSGMLVPIGIAVTGNPTLDFRVDPPLPPVTVTTSSTATSSSTTTSTTTTSSSTTTSTTTTTTTTEPSTTTTMTSPTTVTTSPTEPSTAPPAASTSLPEPSTTGPSGSVVPTTSPSTSTVTTPSTMPPATTTPPATTPATIVSPSSPSVASTVTGPAPTGPATSPAAVDDATAPRVSPPISSGGARAALPATGSDVDRWVLIGLGSILVGLGLLAAAPGRRPLRRR